MHNVIAKMYNALPFLNKPHDEWTEEERRVFNDTINGLINEGIITFIEAIYIVKEIGDHVL